MITSVLNFEFRFYSKKKFWFLVEDIDWNICVAPPLSAFFRKEEEILVTEGLADVHSIAMFHMIYDVGELIGRGSMSLVYACRNKSTLEQFAVKVINKDLCVKKKGLRDEIRVLMSVKHPNIISLEAVYESDRELFLVMERYCYIFCHHTL